MKEINNLEDDDDNGDAGDDEDALMIKRRIFSHPLYEKLVKIHLEGLKVGVVGEAGNDYDHLVRNRQQIMDHNKSSQGVLHQSDLDHFMEVYCVALSKLREAMEEPQQESMAFISSMHSQLRDMTAISLAHSNTSPSPASSGN